MFWTYQKNNQEKYLARTWQEALRKREIARNNYHATGDIKKAKAFVSTVSRFTFSTTNNFESEHVIFLSDTLVVPLRPSYVFT